MTSPSDELRQAAQHIRDVAGHASPPPWRFYAEADVDGGPVVSDGTYELAQPGQDEDGDHIALWDPHVAELVAKMLDAWAKMVSLDADFIHRIGGEETLALARAINAKAGAA